MAIKKIEITRLIDEKMTNDSIMARDLLDKTVTIKSYEQYIQMFSLIKNTFKDKIPEFYERALLYINKMEEFINRCKTYDDIDEINNIYNFVQTYPKERVLTPIDTNGWIYYLEFSNGIKISYCENILSINNEQYTVNNEFEKELSALYETSETEEKIYSSN